MYDVSQSKVSAYNSMKMTKENKDNRDFMIRGSIMSKGSSKLNDMINSKSLKIKNEMVLPKATKVLYTEVNAPSEELEEDYTEKVFIIKTEPDDLYNEREDLNKINVYKKNVSISVLNKKKINFNKNNNNKSGNFAKLDKKFQINDKFSNVPILNISNSGNKNNLRSVNNIKGIVVNKETNLVHSTIHSKKKIFICENGWKALETYLNNLKKKIDDYFLKKESQIPHEYLPNILENLFSEEKIIKVNPKYMEIQKEINEKMRAIIVNWLIEVHYRFKLFPETLFLSVNLLDRYLSITSIKKNRLQLLGVTCLLVACKYEEIFSPEIRDFVCILDKSYDKEDIIKMERDLLTTLKFNTTIASPLKFFEILSISFKLTKKEYFFGRYLLENSLLDHRLNKYYPSLISSSCLYMAFTFFKSDKEKIKENEIFFKVINYKEEEISDCAIDICFIADNLRNSIYQSCNNKFVGKNFCEVAAIKII